MNDLYTPEGWLNFDYILDQGAWLNVIVGARQIGKTYGALLTMLKYDLPHILLRRTTEELETIISTPDVSPYKVFEPDYKIGFFKSGKKICTINDYTIEENGKITEGKQRGIATSLAQIAHIRGFNGSPFTDLIFDEFIPEKGVICRQTEGDSFLNAYRTINGNREITEDRPALRAWLLANSNSINSPILDALELTDIILFMRRKKLETFKTDDNTLIIQPRSERIIEKQKETALMKRISSNSDFYQMAINNEFAYDKSPYVKTMPINGMTPIWAYNDMMFCYERPDGYYICRAKAKVKARYNYEGTRTGREQLYNDFAFIKPFYFFGDIAFADLRLLTLFKNIFNI